MYSLIVAISTCQLGIRPAILHTSLNDAMTRFTVPQTGYAPVNGLQMCYEIHLLGWCAERSGRFARVPAGHSPRHHARVDCRRRAEMLLPVSEAFLAVPRPGVA
jgi:hypothetical protein